MEPNLFVIIAFVINIKTTLQGNQERTFNGTSLDNFHEIVNTLVAENERTEATSNKVNGTVVHVAERRGDKLMTNGEEVINSMKEYTNINESNLHAENRDSKITYLNELLQALPRGKNFDELDSSDLAKILNRRRSNGEPAASSSERTIVITTTPQQEISDLVSKEEITVEIDDHSRAGQPIPSRTMVFNNTLANLFTKNSNNSDGMKPETTTQSPHKEKTTVLSARASDGPKIPFDSSFSYREETTNSKLLTELNKLNAKMDDVEDLLKGNIYRENDKITNSRRSMGIQRSGRIQEPSFNVPYPSNQGSPSYAHANEYQRVNVPNEYQRVSVPNVATKASPLHDDLTVAARNQMLLFQLGRMAQKRQDIALVDNLPRTSGVLLHVPAVYRRRLIVTR